MNFDNIVTVDFETYYDREYSLSRMSTEDYINDPRFEIMLVGVKRGDQEPSWFSGTLEQTTEWLLQFELHKRGVVCHNAMFDCTILQHRCGIRPGAIFDTISMAQAHTRPFTTGVSLAKCLEYYDFAGLRKGTEVHNMIGRTRKSLSRFELERYAEYCQVDTIGEWLLFKELLPLMPGSELRIIDATHRMYLDPVLELDARLLAEILAEERAKKEALLARIESFCSKADLMSNPKFADMLRSCGVEDIPMKVSPKTGELTYAFAKDDPGFKQLVEDYSEDAEVSALLSARTGVKSTIIETRTERLLEIALRYKLLRVPLNYYAAHTGRYGGTQKINMQNPPRVTKSRLRYAMLAPKDHVVLGADLSQIEARIVSWWAKADNLVEAFRDRRDVYSEFAYSAYRKETVKGRSQEDDQRRFVGKTCILGLGFGMGPPKLRSGLRKEGVVVPHTEAQRLVGVYRRDYHQIPSLWNALDWTAIPVLGGANGKYVAGPILFGKGMVMLPNGMPIYYPKLTKGDDGNWTYRYGRETRTLWGGKLTENIVQALARILVMDYMLTIKKELGLEMKLQVHDELDYVVLERDAEAYSGAIAEIMSVPPSWAPDLPVAVEVHYGPTFGDCK